MIEPRDRNPPGIWMGMTIVLIARLTLWHAGARFGLVPLLDVSVLIVLAVGLAIGGLIAAHFAKRWDAERPPLRWLSVLFLAAAMAASGFLPSFLIGALKPVFANIFAMREQGTWAAFLSAPLLAGMLAGLPAVLVGFVLPWTFHRRVSTRVIASMIWGALAAWSFLAIAPAILVPWWPEAFLAALIVGFLLVPRHSKTPEIRRAEATERSSIVSGLLLVIPGTAGMAIWLSAMLRILRSSVNPDAYDMVPLAFLICLSGGSLAACSKPLARRPIYYGSLALLLAGLMLILSRDPFEILAIIHSQSNVWIPLSLYITYTFLTGILLLPLGAIAMGMNAGIGATVEHTRFSRAASGTLFFSVGLLVFALFFGLSSTALLAYARLPNILIAGGATVSTAALLSIVVLMRHEKSCAMTAVIGALAFFCSLVLVAEIDTPWNPASLIDDSGERVVHYRETLDASLVVTQDESRKITAWINGRVEASAPSIDDLSETLGGIYPFLLSPQITRVCIEGIRNGEVLEAILSVPGPRNIFIFEPRASLIGAAVFFRETSGDAFAQPGIKVLRQSLASRMATSNDRYDLILLEGRERTDRYLLELCHSHLSPSGMLVLPFDANQRSLLDFKRTLAGFLGIFHDLLVLETLPNQYLLIGRKESLPLNLHLYSRILAEAGIRQTLAELGAKDLIGTTLSARICTGGALRPLVSEEPFEIGESLRPVSFNMPAADHSEEILSLLLFAQTNPLKGTIGQETLSAEKITRIHQTVARQIQSRFARLDFQKSISRGRMDALPHGRAMLNLSGGDPRIVAYYRESLKELAKRRRRLGDTENAQSIEQSLMLIAPASQPLPNTPQAQLQAFLDKGRTALRQNDFVEAENHYRAALNIKNDHVEARYEVARILLAAGKWPEAVELLEPLRKRTDITPEGRVTLASALAAAGRNEDALVELEKALKTGYEDTALLNRTPFFADLRTSEEFSNLLNRYVPNASQPAAEP